MAQNDFLPFATGISANVTPQATWVGEANVPNGFAVNSVASSADCNKAWRQGSVAANMIGALITGLLGVDALDNADLVTLYANLVKAIAKTSQLIHAPVVVPYSATPVFDESQGDRFEITLTGNVTSSVWTNLVLGSFICIAIQQDGVGSHTFAWPGGTYGAGSVDPAPGAISIQLFYVKSDGSVRAVSGVSVT